MADVDIDREALRKEIDAALHGKERALSHQRVLNLISTQA